MDDMTQAPVETFSAAVAQLRPREDVVFTNDSTRCGSGMGETRDD